MPGFKTLFNLAFIAANLYIYTLSRDMMLQDGCPCATGWQVENINLISKIGMATGAINLVIPLFRTLYAIPIISTVFSAVLILVIGLYMFALARYSRALSSGECANKINAKCKLPSTYEQFVNTVADTGLMTMMGLAVVIAVLVVWCS